MNKTLILLFVVLIVDITARNQKNHQMLYQTAAAPRWYSRRFGWRLAYFRRTCSYEIRCYFGICWRQRVCTH